MASTQHLTQWLMSATDPDAAAAGLMAAFAGIWLFMVLFALAAFAFLLYCYWRIFTKTGHGGPYAFLFLIPGFGPLIVLGLLAFSDWPSLQGRSNS